MSKILSQANKYRNCQSLNLRLEFGQMWWCTHLTPWPPRQRQVDLCEIEASLVCTVSSSYIVRTCLIVVIIPKNKIWFKIYLNLDHSLLTSASVGEIFEVSQPLFFFRGMFLCVLQGSVNSQCVLTKVKFGKHFGHIRNTSSNRCLRCQMNYLS